MDWEQIAQEDALFPWLASDCMAGPCTEEWPGPWEPEEDEEDEEDPDA